MVSKTALVSVRLTPEDLGFLNDLRLNGAETPSEKIRALIAEAKLRKSASKDFQSALRLVGRLLEPALMGIQVAEKDHHLHSQLVRRVLEWLPDTLATVVAEAPELDDDDPAPEMECLENELGLRAMRLMEAVFQIALTRESALYSEASLAKERLRPVLKLSAMVSEQLASEDSQEPKTRERSKL